MKAAEKAIANPPSLANIAAVEWNERTLVDTWNSWERKKAVREVDIKHRAPRRMNIDEVAIGEDLKSPAWCRGSVKVEIHAENVVGIL